MAKILAVAAPLLHYNSTQEKALAARLEELDAHSVLYPLTSLHEVTFDAQGRSLAGGYRLTTWSFFQLCAILAPGLYKCLQDLVGINRKPGADLADFSLLDALDFLNKLTKRRFQNRLCGHQILRDTKAGLIEGIVGGKYRWLPNRQVYLRSKELVTQGKSPVAFYEAYLYGRGLLLRYYNQKPYFKVALSGGVDRFFCGYHFSNNEVGQAALRSAGLLLREKWRTAALTQLSTVYHVGADFPKAVDEVFAKSGQHLLSAEEYKKGVLRLESSKLGLATRSVEQKQARIQQLAATLSKRGLNPRMALRVIESALGRGSFDEEKMPLDLLSEKDWAARSVYDIYNAVGRENRKASIAVREAYDHLAYRLLTGKITLA